MPAEQYIFCVSPGRSGSHYLSQVFSLVDGVCAVHEPEHEFPAYSALRPHFWDLKKRRFAETFARRRALKLAQIADTIGSRRVLAYVETNPMFSTLWHDVVLDGLAGQRVTVIVLHRSPARVLKSLFDLGWCHARDGNTWMVTAYSVNSLVAPLQPEDEASAARLILGHIHNVALYAERICEQAKAAGHEVVDVQSDEIFRDPAAVEVMLRRCGLPSGGAVVGAPGRLETNKPATRTKSFDMPLESCRSEVRAYVRACADAGVPVPPALRVAADGGDSRCQGDAR
jgi:hypothetical protein